MKNNKAFTLIELLAVLIILTIIALIAFPIVNSLLSSQEKKTFQSSVDGLIRTVEADNAARGFGSALYRFDGEKLILEEINEEQLDSPIIIETTGEIKNGSGNITIDTTGNISVNIKNDEYCATKNISDQKISVTECYWKNRV